jgi:cytosine/adenosine deaminase-related metal-dependent hydrolase
VALGPDEWEAMAAVGANLIWSPVSNVTLYGQTADIPGALEAGVTVALSADWTESGSPTILDEMKFASQHSQETWGLALTPLQLTEFVTRNAAHALGVEEWLGQIAPGYRANLMVIPGSPQKPYRTLLRADPADVRLTAVNGRPIYGTPDLMAEFPFLSMTEPIVVGGRTKTLALAVNAHGIPDSDRSFQSILDELLLAYGASTPKVCDFIGIW